MNSTSQGRASPAHGRPKAGEIPGATKGPLVAPGDRPTYSSGEGLS